MSAASSRITVCPRPPAISAEAGISSYILTPVWSVTCDENNETFYAEGGKLYLRADGTLVVLPYGEA